MYPKIRINCQKLLHNASKVLDLCRQNGINETFLVVKVLAGNHEIVRKLANLNFTYLADSRWQNLAEFIDIPKKKALLRLPMAAEIDEVVRYADLSLNSELDTIRLLNEAAKNQGKIHEILVMFDLGDLREGIYYTDDYLPLFSEIQKLKHIRLKGIGTNLTCYGGLIPNREILSRLVKIKEKIESFVNTKLEIISGGNSSSFHLFGKNEIPKEINSLRFGEIVFMGKETAYGKILPGLSADIFTLEAQIIEIQTKPSYPQGEIGMNSFGEKPKIVDEGMMVRGIAAIGKQDVILENLTPLDPKIKIIGGSSDHLLLNLADSTYKLNDIVRFGMNYPGLLHLMNSRYVNKTVD